MVPDSMGTSGDDGDGRSDFPPAFYRRIAEPNASAVIVVDETLCVAWASASTEWLVGVPPQELVGQPGLDFLHPDDQAGVLDRWTELPPVRTGHSTLPVIGRGMPVRVLTTDGPRWFDLGADFRLDDPDVRGIVVRLRPAPHLALIDAFLERSVLDVPLADALMPLLEMAEFENPGSTLMLARGWDGSTFDEVVSSSTSPLREVVRRSEPIADAKLPWVRAITDEHTVVAAIDEMPPAIADQMRAEGFEALWVHAAASGEALPSCIISWRIVGGEPWELQHLAVQRALRLASLAIERREHEQRLVVAATRDALTGLLNRRAFYDLIDRWTDPLAVLFIDLDGFKPINDTLGHDAGDVVLRVIAERLGDAVRDGDHVARLGGDEFAVVLGSTATAADAEGVASRIVSRAEEPIAVDGTDVVVRASIGAAVAPAGRLHPQSLDPLDVVARADQAMYRAKEAGGNRWVIVEAT
jgi:diguanylate cyclase (GGDEF)-like protein